MSRKRGMFTEPDVIAKRMALSNPKYHFEFQKFDRDRSGTIDMLELSDLLQCIQIDVEGGTRGAMFARAFNPSTIMWLVSRFAGSSGGVIWFPQFAEMMEYLENIRIIFKQIDVDRSGAIDLSELGQAFSLSGFSFADCPQDVLQQIGQSYDSTGKGVFSFDDFLLFRLEWDTYLSSWDAVVLPGSNVIAPAQLLSVLETIKQSLEPLASMVFQQRVIPGFNVNSLSPLYYNSMFRNGRPFMPHTCELMVRRFGRGSPYLTFEQFCMMMEFLKEQKKVFTSIDFDKNGALDLNELGTFLSSKGVDPCEVARLGRQYDLDGDGNIQFDEFLQMMTEWEAESKFRGALWFTAVCILCIALALVLQYELVALLLVVIGLIVKLRFSSSHWGELAQIMPSCTQQYGYRNTLILVVAFFSVISLIYLYLQQL